MARYGLGLDHLHGVFSRELTAALTVDSGDTVVFETLDAGWGAPRAAAPWQHPGHFEPRDRERDYGHALTGPVALRGAQPGMALEIRIVKVRPGNWGWSAGSGLPSQIEARLGLGVSASGPPAVVSVPPDGVATFWELDAGSGLGRTRQGLSVRLRPFMGIMGVAAAEAGPQSTFPPRFCGGNMDCKELVEGTRLFLPVCVPGALFSLGDGHAVQGNGEMAGPALACPMEEVEVELHLRPDLKLTMPRAWTPEGWLTFGFHEDLNEAWVQATQEMIQLMSELYPISRKEALSLSSLVVDLGLTQVVNGVRGVHARLAHDALGLP